MYSPLSRMLLIISVYFESSINPLTTVFWGDVVYLDLARFIRKGKFYD